jgi:hypothetical protein
MQRSLECEVCKEPQSAPVSGDWHFRASSFIIEAYRGQGVEAVVWTLWRLSLRARRSFYFAPSMCLSEVYPETRDDGPTAEVDAVAVVDGKLYLCEAKSSSDLSPAQIQKLIAAAARIRPNVLLISCMDKPTTTLRQSVNTLQNQLASDVMVELLEFQPDNFSEGSILPTQQL